MYKELDYILRKSKKGNEKYQVQLYELFCDMVLGICARYSKNSSQRDDMFQEAFLKIFSKLKKVDNATTFPGWIKRLTINSCIDHLKRDVILTSSETTLEEAKDEDSNCSQLDSIAADQLVRLIETLPEGYRIVLNMYVIDGFRHKEIAERLNISESTSRSQLTYAKRSLKKKLKKIGIDRYEFVI